MTNYKKLSWRHRVTEPELPLFFDLKFAGRASLKINLLVKTPFHRRCMEVARSRWAPAKPLYFDRTLLSTEEPACRLDDGKDFLTHFLPVQDIKSGQKGFGKDWWLVSAWLFSLFLRALSVESIQGHPSLFPSKLPVFVLLTPTLLDGSHPWYSTSSKVN